MSTTSMEDDESIVPLLYDGNNENYMETCDDEVNDIVPRLEKLCIGDNEPIYLPSNNMSIAGSSRNVVPSSINNFVEALISDSNEKVHPVFETDTSGMISADGDTEVAVGTQISLSGTDEISEVLPFNDISIPGSSINVVPSSMNNFEGSSTSGSNENGFSVYDGDSSEMTSSDADTGMTVGSQIYLSGTDEISQVLPSNYMNIPGSSMNVVPCSMNNFEEASISDTNKNVHPVFRTDSSDMISADADTEVAVGSQISLTGTDEISEVYSTNSPSLDFISKAFVDGEIHTHPMNTKEEKILNAFRESAETTAEDIIFDENPLDLSLKSSMDSSNSAISENENELPSLVVLPEKTNHVNPETGEVAENSNIVLRRASGSDSKTKTMEQFADAVASGIVLDLDSSKSSYAADISSDDQSNRSSGIILDSPPYTLDIGDVNTALVESKRTRKIAVVPPASVGSKRTRKMAIVPPASLTNEIGQHPLVIFQPPSKTSSSSDGDYKNSSSTGKHGHKTRRKSKKNAKLKNENKNDAVVKTNVESPPKPINLNQSIVKKEEKRPSRIKRKNSETMTQTTEKFHKRSISEHNSQASEKTHLENRSRSVSSGESDFVANPPDKNSLSSNKKSIPRSRKRAISDCNTASRVKFRRPSTSSDDTENK